MYKIQKVGTDCELFLRDAHGLPMPVTGLLGGTKNKPRSVLGGKGFAVQEDNVMAEFNIPASDSAKGFSSNIGKMLSFLQMTMAEKELSLSIVPSMKFHPSQLASPQAEAIGCEPDFCVWTQSENEINKQNPLLLDTRSAGGHVHVSYLYNKKAPNITSIEPFVAALDIGLGLASVIIDKDTTRKKLYGKAGAFRPKEYGVEYRVLSNWWITTDHYREWVFKQVLWSSKLATSWMKQKTDWRGGYTGLVDRAINMQDSNAAHELLQSHAIVLPKSA